MAVRIEKKEQVTTVIIDRPEVRNAVDGPTGEALAAAFREFDADEEAQVAVLWGDHGAFCAGADLKSISKLGAKGTPPYQLSEEGDGPLGPSRMLLSKPVIAAVAGHAVAGGFELALWCDLRVVEEDAVFGVFCRRWGVPLMDGGTIRLPRLIGLSRALDLILTGRPVDAQEAASMGLANRVVPKGQSREAAETLAAEIARFPQVCMRHDRQSAYEQFGMALPDALVHEFHHGMEVIQSGETLKGATHFAKDKQGRHGSFGDLPSW